MQPPHVSSTYVYTSLLQNVVSFIVLFCKRDLSFEKEPTTCSHPMYPPYIFIGLFCRLSSLSQGSFAKETYNLKEPTTCSHHISMIHPIAFGVSFLHSYGIKFVWDHIRMGSHSYGISFIWDLIHMGSHSYRRTPYCIWSVISSISNLNQESSSLGLFCHVPLKRGL